VNLPAEKHPTKRITLNDTIRISGFGLFTAKPTTLIVSPKNNPSEHHSGIVFRFDGIDIPAHIDHLSTIPVHRAFAQMKPRCTSVSRDHVNLATVEHLLSALAGFGITDALIEVESTNPHCEIPIMDGSAINFVSAIQAAGLRTLDSEITPISIAEPISIVENDSSITIEPATSPSYSYTLEYPNQPIPSATVTWDGDAADYINRIAPARTFCLEHEADTLAAAGLFEHLSTKDMLVIGESGPIDNSYRHEHECALHKLLDLIGDLSLVGRPLRAKVTAIKSGHSLAHLAAAAIVKQDTK